MKDNRKYILYMHVNKINGKVYIGITKQSVEKRWAKGKGYKGNPAFWNAIQKYGWNNFEHRIIKENLERKEAEKIEKEYIKKYQSNSFKNGYNISEGGFSGSDTRARAVLCMELKKVFPTISVATKYIKISRGSIQEVCYHKKNKHKAGGFHWIFLDEFNEKYGEINDINIQQAIEDEDNKYKKIYSVKCIETGDIFKNCSEVRKLTGIATVNECLRGNIKSAGSLHWEKVEPIKENILQDLNEYTKGEETEDGVCRDTSLSQPVICLELMKVFYNALKASYFMEKYLQIKFSKNSIRNVCVHRNNAITSGGFHWMYLEDYRKIYGEINELNVNKAINDKDKRYKSKPFSIKCVETGDIFISCAEVRRIIGIKNVLDCALGRRKRVGNLSWVKIEPVKENQIKDISSYINCKNGRKKKVRNVELNIIYNTVTEAAKSVNAHPGEISACAKGKRHTSHGYHWEYIK